MSPYCNTFLSSSPDSLFNFATMKRTALLTGLALCLCVVASAQDSIDYRPQIHGTLRGKYEYQTQDNAGRFEVRTARFSVTGKVARQVDYKAEIDLCDEGQIKMLDAYARITPVKNFRFTIGQMRVPFTIDAHRSPDKQYFANRSFIAKQVGNIRDVGAMIGYDFNMGIPARIEAGLFNGSGLTGQKDYWTKGINFSAKAQFFLSKNLTWELSAQKIKPDSVGIMMYDAGLTWRCGAFLAEAEYLYKTYAHNAYKDVHSVDVFANYDIPVCNGKKLVKKVSPLVRYDFMTDHSDGNRNSNRQLYTTDYQRHRVTAGATVSLASPFVTDIRLNYEKYFYRHDGIPKVSEKDKLVVEVMVHF